MGPFYYYIGQFYQFVLVNFTNRILVYRKQGGYSDYVHIFYFTHL